MPVACICEQCGKTFHRSPSMVGRFCSNACRGQWFNGERSMHWKGGLQTYICETCGTSFERAPSQANKRHYCSLACRPVNVGGERHHSWKGGRHPDSQGYMLVKVPGHPRTLATGYVHEHVVIAEAKIGRPLEPGEHVHHIDRDRANNDPSNLMVLTNSEHLKLHHREGFSRNKSAK